MFRWKAEPRKSTTTELWRRGDKLLKKGKTDEAREVLLDAAQSPSPLDRHYAYVKLILLLGKRMKDAPDVAAELRDICLADIDLFPEFYEAWMVKYYNNIPTPYFPSFSVLADLYEEQGQTDEAIALCELAIGYGLIETRGEDFPVRLERLLAKRKPSTP